MCSQGHKIDIVCGEFGQDAALAFINELFDSHGAAKPGWSKGQAANQITVQVAHGTVLLSEIFDAMAARPESVGIVQWALRQTTMEEVFLKIARASEAEKAKRDELEKGAKSKGGGRCGCPRPNGNVVV